MLSILKSVIKRSDVILEVLDSREPELTRSRRIERIVKGSGKPIILVLNKGDLVPLDVLKGWKDFYEMQGFKCVFVSSREHQGTKFLRNVIKESLRGRTGVVGVIGYPKTGKSSVINVLKGRHAASTSSVPMSTGFTKALQIVRIDSRIYAIDTPGIIPPDGDPLERAIRGSKPEDLEDPLKVAMALIERISRFNKGSLTQAYGTEFSTPLDLLEKIALKRGWIFRKDREPNVDQAAVQLIRDFHEGKIVYYTKPKGFEDDKTSNI
ncbi:GTPase RsgA [Metallosphaera tengchongensis]|uniref:GTPase RsgA n=1 Tax=Metallosphaera tengchongensis TaxID=1532350 RepID=A0A6N0NRL2_9CREN|nr:GTPase [Metallosphaera tengchongensis]QKQ99523.1 GTPase RsgA [Metallosphaera tengchongensis]